MTQIPMMIPHIPQFNPLGFGQPPIQLLRPLQHHMPQIPQLHVSSLHKPLEPVTNLHIRQQLQIQKSTLAPEVATPQEVDPNDILPVEHNTHFNIEQLLCDTILSSEYFKSLYRFNKLESVVEEFIKHAKNLEPRIPNLSTKASTCFCILYKILSLKPTCSQLQQIMLHPDSRVRCLGLLLIRYALKPTLLWQYFEEHLHDQEEVKCGASQGGTMTVSEFATRLLKDIRYYSTTLPRIPKPILAIFKRELVRAEIQLERDTKNENFRYPFKTAKLG